MQSAALLAIGLSIALVSAASADTTGKTDKTAPVAVKPAKAIKPMELTCEEFLSYDEITRPEIDYWSEGMNGKRKGKSHSGVIDVERTNNLVPVLVEDCRQEPKTSYWTKWKQELKKTF